LPTVDIDALNNSPAAIDAVESAVVESIVGAFAANKNIVTSRRLISSLSSQIVSFEVYVYTNKKYSSKKAAGEAYASVFKSSIDSGVFGNNLINHVVNKNALSVIPRSIAQLLSSSSVTVYGAKYTTQGNNGSGNDGNYLNDAELAFVILAGIIAFLLFVLIVYFVAVRSKRIAKSSSSSNVWDVQQKFNPLEEVVLGTDGPVTPAPPGSVASLYNASQPGSQDMMMVVQRDQSALLGSDDIIDIDVNFRSK